MIGTCVSSLLPRKSSVIILSSLSASCEAMPRRNASISRYLSFFFSLIGILKKTKIMTYYELT